MGKGMKNRKTYKRDYYLKDQEHWKAYARNYYYKKKEFRVGAEASCVLGRNPCCCGGFRAPYVQSRRSDAMKWRNATSYGD